MKPSAQANTSDVRVLRYRAPLELKIVLGFVAVLPLLLTATAMVFQEQGWQAAQILPFFLALAAFFWFNNAGYRIGYDDRRLYMRSSNFWNRRVRWPDYHSIAYDDMALIEGRTQNAGPPPDSRLVPHEYLAVVSARPEDEEVWIQPGALHEPELAELLAVLIRRRPDLMPEEVTERVREAGHLAAA